jgi:hypothetical protein
VSQVVVVEELDGVAQLVRYVTHLVHGVRVEVVVFLRGENEKGVSEEPFLNFFLFLNFFQDQNSKETAS